MSRFYYKDGTSSTERDYNKVLHRIDGPAEEFEDGTKCWWTDGKLHRIDGPAEEDSDGSKHWYINNVRHRTDGPAVEYASGKKWWYIDGNYYKEYEFNKIVSEAKALDPILQLTDARWWVRELAKQNKSL